MARELRSRDTDAELRLWLRLKNRRLCGYKFRRQVPIGKYIVDFACHEKKVIIEVDGGQHNLANSKDEMRTATLENAGYLVLRYWNHEVLSNIDGVLESITSVLKPTPIPPHPNPLPGGERENKAR